LDFVVRISPDVARKLALKHRVSIKEVEQAFANRTGGLLEDDRELHRTDPPTQWFVACTHSGRRLKVVFVLRDAEIHLKSCYEANPDEVRIYTKFAE
jgi:uncharacterized DUF497 family protein